MDIYPQDLGREAYRQIQRQRLWRINSGAADAPPPLTDVPVKQKPASLRVHLFWGLAAALVATVFLQISFLITLFVCELAVVLWYGGTWARTDDQDWRSQVVANWAQDQPSDTNARLTLKEIDAQWQDCPDPLMDKYWELARTAIVLPPIAEMRAETERSVRDALRTLGNAIQSLPARSLDGVPADPQELQVAATRMIADAQGESDPVVAASLSRRAEAMQRQAETVARVSVILRRNHALRDEMADQISALRTSLSASALGHDQTGLELASLAAHIQQVAREADAITAARIEVDTVLSRPLANAIVPAVDEYQVRIISH